MKKLGIIIGIGLSITLCGCGRNTVDSEEVTEYEHQDTFTRLNVEHKYNDGINSIDEETVGDSDLTQSEIDAKYEEYGDMSWYDSGTEEEIGIKNETRDNNTGNWNEQYKDKYTSNIVIDSELDVDLSNYTWYNPVENKEFEYNIQIHQWIAYGIEKYFNGSVVGTYSCELPNDIIDSETNMIFTVLVHGDNGDIEVLLDMYNEKIIVNEV